MTPTKHTDHMYQGTLITVAPASANCGCNTSDCNTASEDYVGYLLAKLGLNLDCKRMLDDRQ